MKTWHYFALLFLGGGWTQREYKVVADEASWRQEGRQVSAVDRS